MTNPLWMRLSLSTAVALVLATPVLAHAKPADTGASSQVEEVVVTAERRETKLQQTPIAISALTSKTLADAGRDADVADRLSRPQLA